MGDQNQPIRINTKKEFEGAKGVREILKKDKPIEETNVQRTSTTDVSVIDFENNEPSMQIDQSLDLKKKETVICKLQLTLHKARNLKNLDIVGKSDPYVVIKSGKQELKSSTQKNTLNPEWNWTTDVLIDESDPEMAIYVYDSDKFGKDDLMGALTLKKHQIKEFETKGTTWMKFDDGKQGEILISCKTPNKKLNVNKTSMLSNQQAAEGETLEKQITIGPESKLQEEVDNR